MSLQKQTTTLALKRRRSLTLRALVSIRLGSWRPTILKSSPEMSTSGSRGSNSAAGNSNKEELHKACKFNKVSSPQVSLPGLTQHLPSKSQLSLGKTNVLSSRQDSVRCRKRLSLSKTTASNGSNSTMVNSLSGGPRLRIKPNS